VIRFSRSVFFILATVGFGAFASVRAADSPRNDASSVDRSASPEANSSMPDSPAPIRSMHPKFKMLDKLGKPVVQSGAPISTMRTCGACHDAQYIEAHNYHASAGWDERVEVGKALDGRPWDLGPGLFGRWDSLSYGPSGPDLEVRDWLMKMGDRHVGGGPARASGVELDCFLCHIASPDMNARREALKSGSFDWVNTATLASTRLVKKEVDGWKWNASRFSSEGEPIGDETIPRLSTSKNCGLCHGLVADASKPVVLPSSSRVWGLETKGQIFSPQRLKDSGLNLVGKDSLSRSFDVHAERLLECSSCHNTINNPTFFSGTARDRPKHLVFEPRRLDLGEYLARPDHDLAKGNTAQGTSARRFAGTMRRCENCHDPAAGHDWLPYSRRHMRAMNCETCHVPRVYAPARSQTDWTFPERSGEPRVVYRSAKGDPHRVSTPLAGFDPVLLPRIELDGSRKLTPYNLIVTWYWTAGDPPAPVDLDILKQAIYQENDYRPEVKAILDDDRDGKVEAAEERLDTAAKAEVVAGVLKALGLRNPRIRGEIQPYGLHHGTTSGEFATRRCVDCHGERSRLTKPIDLSEYVPGGAGAKPVAVADANVLWNGELAVDRSGRLSYEPRPTASNYYIMGRDRRRFVDSAGIAVNLAAFLGVLIHGGLRFRAARKAK
jgi:formate-dependent nitrite reductase cytochrome c552 subunit